jgi:S-formylglutathione hydrolase FrmB
MRIRTWIGVAVIVSLGSVNSIRAQSPFPAQSSSSALTGTVERIKLHGKFLEGNLEGDSPDRDVAVYLPPSYAKDRHRRYPVVYFLHGWTQTVDKWYGRADYYAKLPTILNKALAAQQNREMIFVTPDAFTRYQGSFYSNSVTTGNWEDYIVSELIPYVDAHYRTIAGRTSRGLAGHSMGGYGTIRIAMRHPDLFSSIYLLSACCMEVSDSFLIENGTKAETAKTPEQVNALGAMPRALFAVSAAWAPNPKSPPFFADFPVNEGKLVEEVVAKFHANEPLYMIDQYVGNLRQLDAIAFDVGNKDTLWAPGAQKLDNVLTSYGIAHQFEIYEGNHLDHIPERIEIKVVPFFSQSLSFEQHHR